MVYIGKVVSLKDDTDSERIKVRIKSCDSHKTDDELPYAFPVLPKHLHIKPKVNEAVLVFCLNDKPDSQRLYVGPISSQAQNLFYDDYNYSALSAINGDGKMEIAVSNIPDTYGAFAADNEVAIYGRKNSDIILGDDDVRIRCGVKVTGENDKTKVEFNRENNPSYIKLKYHTDPLDPKKKEWSNTMGDMVENSMPDRVESSVNIVGQEINLISTNGDPYANVTHTDFEKDINGITRTDNNEGITDTEIKKMIEEAHQLPYGDVLLKFLYLFVKAFKSHTHRYSQLPPVEDVSYKALDSFNLESILSKNVRIN